MRRTLVAALAFVVGGVTAGHAQVVNGTLLERAGGRAIEGVEVTLMRAGGAELAKVRTDSAGKFALVAPRPGEYAMRVRRLGFEAVTTSLFTLDSAATITPTLRLTVVPGTLKTVRVVAENMPAFDWTRGFEERRSRGLGYFITRSDIDRHAATMATDAFRGVPGIQVTPVSDGGPRGSVGNARWVLASGRGDRGDVYGAGGCGVVLYVDGMTVDDLNETIRADDIQSAEVYTSSRGVPLGFRAGLCGTVIVWTKATRPPTPRDTVEANKR